MREWLRDARIKKGLSQKDLAEKLDISESYYFYIEEGTRQPKMDITLAAKLAHFLSLKIQQIVEYEENWRNKK